MKELSLLFVAKCPKERYVLEVRNKKFIIELGKKPRLRRESGLYVIDGPKMAAEIDPLDAEDIFVTKEFLSSANAGECMELLSQRPFSVISESDMKKLSDTVSPQGILVVAKQKRFKGLSGFLEAVTRYGGVLKCEPLILVLETIQDPGNLGTIIRASEAAGVTGIIADEKTVDIYSPKVVRSTMGAILRLPYITVKDLSSAVKRISDGSGTGGRGFAAYAARLDGAVEYYNADMRGPAMVMIGNESRGLTDELSSLADTGIVIPMTGNTESLNAAVAAGVICFEAAKQRKKS